MTLHDVQVELVENKKVFTSKQLTGLVIRTVLTILLYGMTIGFLVFELLGISASLLVLILFSLLFLWLFDACSEDVGFAQVMYKVTRFWFTGIPVFIITFVLMKYFNII